MNFWSRKLLNLGAITAFVVNGAFAQVNKAIEANDLDTPLKWAVVGDYLYQSDSDLTDLSAFDIYLQAGLGSFEEILKGRGMLTNGLTAARVTIEIATLNQGLADDLAEDLGVSSAIGDTVGRRETVSKFLAEFGIGQNIVYVGRDRSFSTHRREGDSALLIPSQGTIAGSNMPTEVLGISFYGEQGGVLHKVTVEVFDATVADVNRQINLRNLFNLGPNGFSDYQDRANLETYRANYSATGDDFQISADARWDNNTDEQIFTFAADRVFLQGDVFSWSGGATMYWGSGDRAGYEAFTTLKKPFSVLTQTNSFWDPSATVLAGYYADGSEDLFRLTGSVGWDLESAFPHAVNGNLNVGLQYDFNDSNVDGSYDETYLGFRYRLGN